MNESIIALPPNVEEPQVLKRFLQNLIIALDEVLGYRGDNASVRASDLASVTTSITQTTGVTLAGLAEELETLQAQVNELTGETEDSNTGVNDRLDALELQTADFETRITALETWRVAAQAELDNHETRITALENP